MLILAVIAWNTANSQNTANERVIAFSASKMNVVYGALDNPLTIVAAGIPSDKLVITSSKGTISQDKGGNGKFILSLPDIRQDVYKEVQIKVYNEKVDPEHELYKQSFRAKIVPVPVAYFGEKEGGYITKEEALAVNSIKVNLFDFSFDGLEYTVTKYKLVVASKKKAIVENGTSSEITEKMKSAIANVVEGDMIIITDIYASFPGSADLRLPGAITLTVFE
jgi:hypothetical protein